MSSSAIASSSTSPIELQNNTPQKTFKPTPLMFHWLDTVLRNDTPIIDEIARISGIQDSTYYRWLKQDGFIEWFEAERNKGLRAHAWRLDNFGMQAAMKGMGDFKFWEAMQKRVGNLNDSSDVSPTTLNFQINFKRSE